MIKNLLLGAAVLTIGAPSFAQSVPYVGIAVNNITSNVACRNKVRSKYFELGATNMSDSNSNSQWGTINGMKANVWCRDTQAIIVTAGPNQAAVHELRDELHNNF